MHVWRTASSTEEANWGTDITDVVEAILYEMPFATPADLRLKEKLDPGSSGESLQQPNCLSEREWRLQLHFGRCMLFQKVLSIASAAVGYVGLPSALGWDGRTDDEVLASIAPALHNHCSRSVFDVHG